MLNEPVGEGGDAPEVGDMGAAGDEGAPVNYIQVTPQEKEAIERVSSKGGRGVNMVASQYFQVTTTHNTQVSCSPCNNGLCFPVL